MKSRLKEVIDYADNPEKTTEPKYLDEDLYATLSYAENEEKTDQQVYVAGINCSVEHAYEEMAAIQKRFGNRGSVVAYHGYQSFASGEVTPEEALAIGKETAKAMWGDKYQVLVTVHLNTDNLHCHFVVNAVSFVDGGKFRNKIGDHKELRKISDRICREHEKSVLENSSFYGGEKKSYWIHQQGKKTHRDQLKEDVGFCLKYAPNFDSFIQQLKKMGYTVDPVRLSVRAQGWKRSVRLSGIGYPEEMIRKRLEENLFAPDVFITWNTHRLHHPKEYPLEGLSRRLEFSLDHAHDPATLLVDTLFLLLITLFRIADEMADVVILSPDLRHEVKNVQQFTSDLHFLRAEGVRSMSELDASIRETERKITKLEQQRSKADNRRRRAKTPEERMLAKKERSEITKQISPLRKKQKQLKQIQEKAPALYELLKTEYQLEKSGREKVRSQVR